VDEAETSKQDRENLTRHVCTSQPPANVEEDGGWGYVNKF